MKCTQLVRASKDLAQTSYFMATNSLHLTTFCLQYPPSVVACVCIHLACKWSSWEIPVSSDGKHWWEYVDGSVTQELLDELTHEFLLILEKTPNRLKHNKNWRASQTAKKGKESAQQLDESASEQTMLNMISRVSSDSIVAGLMSMSSSSSSSSSSMPSVNRASSASVLQNPSGGAASVKQQWQAPVSNTKVDSSHIHKTKEPPTSVGNSQPNAVNLSQAGSSDLPLQGDSSVAWSKQANTKHQTLTVAPPANKVSLNEYRAKRAEELAAQKRKLETLVTNVKEQYAAAAHALVVQQQKEKQSSHTSQSSLHKDSHASHLASHKDSHTSQVILKSQASGTERAKKHADRGDKVAKVNVPSSEKLTKQEEVKIQTKSLPAERCSSSEESVSRCRDQKEKHKEHLSVRHNHHQPHHHSMQKDSHTHSNSSKHSGDSRHGSLQGSSSHGSHSSSKNSSSRKRAHTEDLAMQNHQPKMSKPSSVSSHTSSSSYTSGVSEQNFHHAIQQAAYKQTGSLGKADKGLAGAVSHSIAHTSEYKDPFQMLNSVLSTQSMHLTQPAGFDYIPGYHVEYKYPAVPLTSNSSSKHLQRLPPLPADPPPPLPPLPK